MAKEDDEQDEQETLGIPDLDAAPGPPRRQRGGELAENEDLDSEGQPDLIGALPEKEITGDAQEGEIPPREYKQAPDDYWSEEGHQRGNADEFRLGAWHRRVPVRGIPLDRGATALHRRGGSLPRDSDC